MRRFAFQRAVSSGVEQRTFNPLVGGSNPPPPTNAKGKAHYRAGLTLAERGLVPPSLRPARIILGVPERLLHLPGDLLSDALDLLGRAPGCLADLLLRLAGDLLHSALYVMSVHVFTPMV